MIHFDDFDGSQIVLFVNSLGPLVSDLTMFAENYPMFYYGV